MGCAHRRHPSVVRAAGLPKELHYFDYSWELPFSRDDAARYAEYFPRPDGAITGEWTPGYLIDFWTPDLLAAAAPEARVLILLRDPLERFRSSLSHQMATSRQPLVDRDIQGAFQRGVYAPQLRRVLDAFPADRVFIGQYEACRADPLASWRGRSPSWAWTLRAGPRHLPRRGQPDDRTALRAVSQPARGPGRGLCARPRAAPEPRAGPGPLALADRRGNSAWRRSTPARTLRLWRSGLTCPLTRRRPPDRAATSRASRPRPPGPACAATSPHPWPGPTGWAARCRG